jgi:outer membrane receptor protein involved in Fe transport
MSHGWSLVLLLGLTSSLARAEATASDVPVEIQVTGERHERESGAADLELSGRELALRPSRTPGDVLEAVPGLIAVQHAGGGKANQLFLRGFDADHGTDVALFLNGVPLNQRSHGHGQGYADFNFVIPELIQALDVHKGPNDARYGDFATAGAVEVKYLERLPDNFVRLQYGQFGERRAVVGVSPRLGDGWSSLLALEAAAASGPFQVSEELQKLNFVASLSHAFRDGSELNARVMSYGASWNGSGQLPLRAVCGEGEAELPPPSAYGQPCIDRFGSIDPTEGGSTARQSAELGFRAQTGGVRIEAQLFAVRYQFGLFSNFTFYAVDPRHGDGIEQTDERTTLGSSFRLSQERGVGTVRFKSTFGVESRADDIDNGLYHQQVRRRLDTVNAAHVAESSIGAFLEERAALTPWLSTTLALRVERLQAQVEPRAGNQLAGSAHATLPLPKFGIQLKPWPTLTLFGQYARGFHSNDARSAAAQNARLMAPALGYEAGLRWRADPQLQLYATAFLLDLSSELVWAGDEGTTEASPASRRTGVELGARAHFNHWLFADVDASFARARFDTGNAADHVPLAPTATLTAGLGAHPKFGNYRPFGSLRVTAVAARPANEDATLTAPSYVIEDLSAGLRYRDVEAGVEVMNLLDTPWRPVNFATRSRLQYEPTPVTGIHFVPGWPRTIMGHAALYWQ